MKIVPIIPSLNPDNNLIKLVDNLSEHFNKIIIVDDGSKEKNIFEQLKHKRNIIVLEHEVNKGKGAALKTAFNFYKDHLMKSYNGVICVDSDGQHKVSDCLNICTILEDNDMFVLGTRLFNTKDTPLRNKIGNKITSRLFKVLNGVYLKDTQTGLRAIPNRLIDLHINTVGERFEYEMNTLSNLVKENEKIIQIDIETIYTIDEENTNKKSSFRVIKDSYKVYKNMFKNRKR